MAKDFSEISVDDALDAQQKALAIEQQKKLAQKERVAKKKKTKRKPKDLPPSLKERLVAPLLLGCSLLLGWIVWWLSNAS